MRYLGRVAEQVLGRKRMEYSYLNGMELSNEAPRLLEALRNISFFHFDDESCIGEAFALLLRLRSHTQSNDPKITDTIFHSYLGRCNLLYAIIKRS